METEKNYFVVGLFVMIFIAAGLGFTVWLTSADQGDFVRYRIRFAESVSGLEEKSKVKFRGVNVGNIEKISIDKKNADQVVVDINVLADTPIKTDTTATLKLRGITGDIYVELTGGSEDASELKGAAKEDSTLPEIRAEKSSINAIMNRLPQLLEKANHIADQISKIFSDQNVKAVNGMVKKISGSSDDKTQEN